jgi:hypothetical protein
MYLAKLNPQNMINRPRLMKNTALANHMRTIGEPYGKLWMIKEVAPIPVWAQSSHPLGLPVYLPMHIANQEGVK